MSSYARPLLVDVLLAVALTALTELTMATGANGPPGWQAYVLAAFATAPIALRQRAPVATMAVILAAVAGYSLLGYRNIPGGGVGVLIGLFTVATLRSRATAAAAWVLTTAILTLNIRFAGSVTWTEGVQGALVAMGAWALGEATRRWGQRVEALGERAGRAVADERGRIARELHDIVAHHMSVISLQAGLARYVLDTDLPTAKAAMATVGDTSREALTELRRLLDVLRVDHGEDDGAAPDDARPGLASLEGLVERMRGAGLPVEVVVRGHARALPPGPDTCAYRVVQESLTNVLKHAGPATARVDLDYGDRLLAIRVSDDGATPEPFHLGPDSRGLRGMRERVELLGGVFTAEPVAGGGFAVTAEVPVEPAVEWNP
ncbi:sensor histidine kinase [Actinokineospora auranticolor]|uniref:sensor histidine kinase n=1 Tax=Actinokineospora auranticolor TaxID=155976 RepID=UPI001FE2DF9B|nr:sensor histidine kinase [Actinokineospora auranticolor]